MDEPRQDETPHRYTAQFANAIESRWQAAWEDAGAYRAPNPDDAGFDAHAPKFYCLDMFPYPSGAGLHVGHPLGYIATDIVCRARRMQGFNVLHPMGWDAFGLPAEQYAVQTGVHPAHTTRQAIDTYRRQLQRFGFCYDWSREISTIDPDYYRWTQWIWLQCYAAWYDHESGRARPIAELVEDLEAGRRTANGRAWSALSVDEQRAFLNDRRLAYRGEQTVNWCPKLGTVLANEEVIDGKSERGGYPVLRMPLRQWMFRITAYAERLLADLDRVQWPESTRTMQAEWIGRSEGAEIDFSTEGFGMLRVFTTRPDTLFGATYMVVAPEHPLVQAAITREGAQAARVRDYAAVAAHRSDVDRQSDAKQKTGVDTGFRAVNPVTGELIPIWTADYVLMGYGTGAIMAVPAHDQRDYEFARAFQLPIRQVVEIQGVAFDGSRATSGTGVACHSAGPTLSIDGLKTVDAKASVIDWLESHEHGCRRVNFRLRDWLFSRQRYWGEPFPVVFDEAGHHWPVMESALPVRLPDLADYRPIESDAPMPPLGKATDWVNTTAGEAGVDPALLPPSTPVRRETNTMPGWAGSCWYYLRYADPHNTERFIGRAAERYWFESQKRDGTPHAGGVDLYVGGAEHAVLHLLYSRFWHKVLFDLGHVGTPEPFGRLFHQGMLTAYAYQRTDGSLVAVDQVLERGGAHHEVGGGPVTQVIAKMSKSLRNVINPDDVIAEYGADTFRLYEMAMGPLEASKPWNTRDIAGVHRFLQRVWRLAVDEQTGDVLCAAAPDPALERALHRTIHKVSGDIDRLAFNTAIASMIELVNEATRPQGMKDPSEGGLTRDQLERFVRLLAPFAPHVAEELWAKLGGAGLVVHAAWPTADAQMLIDEDVEIAVQVMGKVRARIRVPTGADAAKIESITLQHADVLPHLGGKTPRKVIVVPGRMVNLVL